MSDARNRVFAALVLVGITGGMGARGQTLPSMRSGGMTREAMYLRLFQEIGNFEAQAGALEAGVQATNLRGYHQRRLGLSEAHAELLKQTAIGCVRDLRSSGMFAQRGGSRPPVPAAETVRIGMARVSAAVESMRAAMGPAEFAYVDSMVRRYVSTPVPRLASGGTPAGSGTAAGTGLGVARVEAAAQQDCCTMPDGEDSSLSNGVIDQGGVLGGWFDPLVYGHNFVGRTVWEENAYENDECYSAYHNLAGAPSTPTTDPGGGGEWEIVDGGWYDAADDIAQSLDWAAAYMALIRFYGLDPCYEAAQQQMYIDQCGAGCSPYTTNYPGVGVAAAFWVASRGNGTVTIVP